jgi:hypothetical protein
MHDIVKVHTPIVVKELCDLMETVSRHGHRKVAAPFDGFYIVDAKILLEPASQLLQ